MILRKSQRESKTFGQQYTSILFILFTSIPSFKVIFTENNKKMLGQILYLQEGIVGQIRLS